MPEIPYERLDAIERALGGRAAIEAAHQAGQPLAATVAALTSEIARAQAAEATSIPLSQRGAANGVATLDGSGRQPVAQSSLSAWNPRMLAVGGQFASGVAAGFYVLTAASKLAIATAGSAFAVVMLDPADFGGANPVVRLRASVICNSVDPAAGNWVFGLFPVTGYGGGSNVDPTITVGPAVATATVTPAVSSIASATGASVAFPAAGAYVLGVTLAAPTAVNSGERVSCILQARA